MSISDQDLIDEINDLSDSSAAEPTGSRPRVTSWVQELPRATRTSEFDDAIAEVRQGVPGQWAVIEGPGGKPLTANKIASLKKRYPDISFKLIRGIAYASVKEAN